ncbi:hypothetical protein SLE2022_114670 [Rubroshorea leprosula]
MDNMTAYFPYPLHHCKILHLVRHGQAMHNVEGDKNRDALLSPHLFDAKLSPLGCEQVDQLRKHFHASGLLNRIDLVITSPLLRAIQTAVGVFGGNQSYIDRVKMAKESVTPANEGDIDFDVVSTPNCPKIMAVELCRDRNGLRPCDKRRRVSDYQLLFPSLDYSMMDSDEDNLWIPDIRESEEELVARGMKLMKWLWTRPEKEIAVVSHGIVLQQMLNVLGNDCNNTIRTTLCKRFDNGELRSVVIVDKTGGMQ